MVKFTLNFTIDDGKEKYKEFIEKIRQDLSIGDPIESVLILAPQVPAGEDLEFFDINLSNDNNTIQMRFRTDNLYLIGYRRQNSNTWYELGHTNGGESTLINEPNTTTEILRFGENYNRLTTTAHITLDAIPLNSAYIGQAITTLYTNGATNPASKARAILILIFAIAEAARFRDISCLVYRSWWRDDLATPGQIYANRVRSWSRLSTAVQRTRNEGYSFDFFEAGTQIWAFVTALEALGIMHNISRGSVPRPKRSIINMVNNQEELAPYASYVKGQPLLEIFRVRVDDIDGENPGNLYGTITVTDSTGTLCVWKRERDGYIPVRPGEDILLEGPGRLVDNQHKCWPVSAADEFYIDLNLWDSDSISPDDPIARGTITFNPFDYYTRYNVVEDRKVRGKYGSVTVSYMAITEGLYARIKVILVNGDNEDPADVYGNITADNGNGSRKSELFRKASEEYIDVNPQCAIPLSRTVVAVPTNNILRVDAYLLDYDSIGSNDEIAKGFAEFRPLYKQSQREYITGAYGKIEVQVEWM
ncbi:hypothetical protein PT974_04724 [Cladobotryum mycophilum]|uniref:DUF6598 domain-containing protein n=1 Tax=Cladobotryum mycophilum TaxID=491253 RepID=A0ABR0SSI9_9HYPO